MTEPPAFASTDLAVVRRNPWVLGLAMSPFLGVLALILGGILVYPGLLFVTPHLTAIGAILTALAYRRNWRPVVTPASVRADMEGVTAGDLFLPRAAIRGGFVVPGVADGLGREGAFQRARAVQRGAGQAAGGSAPRVIFHRRFRPALEIQVSTTAEGRALLRSLGLDASQTVADFRALSRARSKRRYGMAAGLTFGALGAAFAFVVAELHNQVAAGVATAALVIGAVVMTLLFVMPTQISVGADGIALRWLWTRRFLGFDAITGISQFDKGWGNSRIRGIRVTLRWGASVDLATSQGQWGDGDTAILLERIREAMDTFREGGSAADAALLRRGDRGVGEWVTALRSLGAGANAGMRTAPMPRERLLHIVEDPAAPAASRAAAAVALGSELDDESRARLRSAAAATAAPRLRIAIEKAAGGEDEAEIEAALADIDAAEGEPRARAS